MVCQLLKRETTEIPIRQLLKFNSEMFYAVVQHAISSGECNWEANAFTRFLKDLLVNQLGLCNEPYNMLVVDGYAQSLHENLPRMIKLFAICLKFKVATAAMFS